MLVLSRKVNEGVVVDGKCRIVVVGVKGDKVRLGIIADKDVPVHRDEVWVKINGDAVDLGLERDKLIAI